MCRKHKSRHSHNIFADRSARMPQPVQFFAAKRIDLYADSAQIYRFLPDFTASALHCNIHYFNKHSSCRQGEILPYFDFLALFFAFCLHCENPHKRQNGFGQFVQNGSKKQGCASEKMHSPQFIFRKRKRLFSKKLLFQLLEDLIAVYRCARHQNALYRRVHRYTHQGERAADAEP